MNVRRQAVLEMAQRYNYDPDHAHQVECLAGTLFLELEPLHQLGREDRKLLEYAAILHDIGYYVSAQSHHKHALQMIMLEPLLDFTRTEKLLIANLARYHRKALPSMEHTPFGMLPDAEKRKVGLMAPILRLADALDKSHQQLVQDISCEITDHSFMIFVGCEASLAAEIEAIRIRSDFFRHIYKRDVEVQALRPRLAVPASNLSYALAGV